MQGTMSIRIIFCKSFDSLWCECEPDPSFSFKCIK